MGTKAICSIDTYVYSSIQGTVESITAILLAGRINDAYALLRKYYDSAVINVYSNLYLRDNFSIDNFVVEKIHNWLQGKEKLPEYRVMSQYIKVSDTLRPINELLGVDDRYKRLRTRCNDHTHYNFFPAYRLFKFAPGEFEQPIGWKEGKQTALPHRHPVTALI
jgi:hypothetical protein